MTSDAGWRALQEQLRDSAPAGIRDLPDDRLLELAAAVRDARQRQATELAAAGDRALHFIPRLLRGPVQKMFG